MTSIEWLIEEMIKYGYAHTFKLYQRQIEQAKEMHKQEIVDAYHINPLETKWQNEGIKYYNETFKQN